MYTDMVRCGNVGSSSDNNIRNMMLSYVDMIDELFYMYIEKYCESKRKGDQERSLYNAWNGNDENEQTTT